MHTDTGKLCAPEGKRLRNKNMLRCRRIKEVFRENSRLSVKWRVGCLLFILALFMALSVVGARQVLADDAGTCGYSGDNLTYTFQSDTGVLTISGSGKMRNYSFRYGTTSPWDSYRDQITSLVIQKGVTSIGDNTFYDCTALSSITIPDSVTSIGEKAFYDCTDLSSIAIPGSVTKIEEKAFKGCTNLSSVIFESGEGLHIEEKAFYSCPKLSEVAIPESVTYIGSYAFGYEPCDADENNGLVIRPACSMTIYGVTGSTAEEYAQRENERYESHVQDGQIDAFENDFITFIDLNVTGIAGCTVTLEYTSAAYTGRARKPEVTVTYAGITMTKNTDYTVSYSNNVNAGTAKVTITGTGSYKGTVTKKFKIKAKSLSAAKVTLKTTSYTYDGKAKKPTVSSVKLTVGGSTKKLKKGTDYKVSYSNNKKIGTAAVTITGKGNYKGSIKKTFKINPGTVTLKSSTKSAAAKSITVKWGKVSGTVKYKIAYRVKGSSTWKYKTVSADTYSKKLTGLKSGKKYVIKVKAYKKVNGKTYSGNWSSTRTVKVK